jgi:hypothetical protein
VIGRHGDREEDSWEKALIADEDIGLQIRGGSALCVLRGVFVQYCTYLFTYISYLVLNAAPLIPAKILELHSTSPTS